MQFRSISTAPAADISIHFVFSAVTDYTYAASVTNESGAYSYCSGKDDNGADKWALYAPDILTA